MYLMKKPEPLRISCLSTECDANLHCFKATRSMPNADRGKCRECNCDLVDWKRVHARVLGDAAYTFEALKYEKIRHHFFHTNIDQKAINYAHRKGRLKLKDAIRSRIEKYLAPAEPYRDGQQTPFQGNAIFYGQHATACCCRTCLEYWHDIPKGYPLTEAQVDYCVELLELYFDERMPDLGQDPIHVPPIRNA